MVTQSDVTAMHPIDAIARGLGRDPCFVGNFAKISSNGRVELRDQRICVGEDLAYETGREHVNVLIAKDQVQANYRVSNVYRREGSEWRMVHHHVDFDPTVLEMVRKLETNRQT